MFHTTVTSVIDAEFHSMAGAVATAAPSPSLGELQELAAVCGQPLRVTKITAADGNGVAGLAVCYVHTAQIHGVSVRAYRLFGYHLHDYNRIHVRDAESLHHLLAELRCDARRCNADVVCLDNLLPPPASQELNRYAGTLTSHLQVFDSALDQLGWKAIHGKKSVRRHANKVAGLPGYRVETLVGDIAEVDLKMVAKLHVERWHFEGATSVFSNERRIREYLCHPHNKILTRVFLGGELLCCHYGMIYGKTLLWHTPLINIKYLDYSPLEVLLAETAEFCGRNDLTCLDLGLGDEAYKSRFSNSSRLVYDVMIPVSARGRLVHLIRTQGHPERVKWLVASARRRLGRVRNAFTAMGSRIHWYEKMASHTAGQSGSDVTIICNYEAFVDFARVHKFTVKRSHYQRFREGCFFAALCAEDRMLSYGWGSRSEQFYIGETGQTVSVAGRTVLFDFYTPPACRRHGYYTKLLGSLAKALSNETLAIFARVNNHASNKAIVKVGFTRTPQPAPLMPRSIAGGIFK